MQAMTKLTQHIEQHTIILNELVSNSRNGNVVDSLLPGDHRVGVIAEIRRHRSKGIRPVISIPAKVYYFHLSRKLLFLFLKYIFYIHVHLKITRLAAVGGSGLESELEGS
jgi:hypothetical protein